MKVNTSIFGTTMQARNEEIIIYINEQKESGRNAPPLLNEKKCNEEGGRRQRQRVCGQQFAE